MQDGYLITEAAYTAAPKIVSDKADITIIETVLQEAEAKNRNGRIYAKDTLFGSLKSAAIQEKLRRKSWVGEAGKDCHLLQ